jgi:hypothetical protein
VKPRLALSTRPGRLSRRHLQVALGALWLLDAALECQGAMFHAQFFGDMLMMNMSAPPSWLWDMITKVEPVVTAHPVMANALAVAVQVAIGAGLLWRRSVRPALALSVPWALAVWLFGEAAGGIFVQGASALTGAPGAALIYLAVALMLWPRRDDETSRPVADGGLLPPGAPTFAWVALWVGTAALEGGYLDRSPGYAAQAMDNAALTGPSWLHAAGMSVGNLVGNNGALFAAAAGTVQAVAGVAVLWPRIRRPALVAGMALAVFYGAVGQAFGGVFAGGLTVMSSGATDPGTAPAIVLLALSAWPRPQPAKM